MIILIWNMGLQLSYSMASMPATAAIAALIAKLASTPSLPAPLFLDVAAADAPEPVPLDDDGVVVELDTGAALTPPWPYGQASSVALG